MSKADIVVRFELRTSHRHNLTMVDIRAGAIVLERMGPFAASTADVITTRIPSLWSNGSALHPGWNLLSVEIRDPDGMAGRFELRAVVPVNLFCFDWAADGSSIEFRFAGEAPRSVSCGPDGSCVAVISKRPDETVPFSLPLAEEDLDYLLSRVAKSTAYAKHALVAYLGSARAAAETGGSIARRFVVFSVSAWSPDLFYVALQSRLWAIHLRFIPLILVFDVAQADADPEQSIELRLMRQELEDLQHPYRLVEFADGVSEAVRGAATLLVHRLDGINEDDLVLFAPLTEIVDVSCRPAVPQLATRTQTRAHARALIHTYADAHAHAHRHLSQSGLPTRLARRSPTNCTCYSRLQVRTLRKRAPCS
jgi:hypothetical protein